MQEAAKHRGPLPQSVSAVLRLCRSLKCWNCAGAIAAPTPRSVRSPFRYIPAITRTIGSPPVGEIAPVTFPPDALVPANVFRRFAERLSAGEALERAKHLERERSAAEAQAESGMHWKEQRAISICCAPSASSCCDKAIRSPPTCLERKSRAIRTIGRRTVLLRLRFISRRLAPRRLKCLRRRSPSGRILNPRAT